ncbi:type I DNA topoisomerase [Kineosporia rhizophila]|uniref:type I DNA topoisomerase n=1 Tax=Kineosporia TaxID=49184 RepID=UPI001E33249A|nr:type I DNA topoisomerase [Kineosporia sp. NBRC 101677]MCE0535994.1 type I DNA topoisomerase [Kineosporia rhizophila]GLY14172.1 DNA topoisomerase 1 [Kineosporia sp. NBRC 101677]
MAASKTTNGRRLVIVESPTKARKIAEYLGPEFDVEASVGHIRDLPQPSELPPEMKKGPFGKFAVDVDNGFEAYYVVDADKKKKVGELKRALKDADELYLATDEDREGEAIAWHLLEVLQPKIPVHRMVFHEITREAISRALQQTRDLDERLVDAQETRRILDRLYGYEVSPVLWRKVRAGLSAGRVQSVATRLVVERERERMAFRAASYWDLTGDFAASEPHAQAGRWFGARLVALDERRVATGRDFDDTGRLTSPDVVHLDEAAANALVRALEGASTSVRSVEEKPYRRRPAAPFTTSTLQQEAGRKLRLSAKQAMRTAQSLYENGYITYMRTDSTTLSDQAVNAARQQAADLYGAEYVPAQPRVYASKSKNAQEAHEAIRPAGDHFRTPAQVSSELSGDEFRLYELIWKRTVASQMEDARGSTATIRLGARTSDGRDAVFGASGTVITFRGFLAAYEEGRDEERHGGDDDERRLPELAVGDALDTRDLTADGHTTSPPPRYTQASLVKALEERGIGRPSTYAATIDVIVNRGYVGHKGNALVPTWLAFAVTRLLEEHFGGLVDYEFTASMEADLDQIAAGEQDRRQWLARFYFGDGSAPEGDGSSQQPRPAGPDAMHGLKPLVDDLGDIDARDINSVPLGEGIVLRVGRYGPYLEVPGEDGEARRASVPDDVAPDELTVEKARELLETQADGDRELGTDPDTGRQIVARNGRFGPYVTEILPDDAPKSAKPRTGSLFKSMDVQSVTLDEALRLLSLPRLVGVDPETNEEVTAQNGRYGPYLKRGTDSRSLETEDQIFTVTMEQAQAIYAQPKQRGRRAAAPPLRELGPDPVTEAPIVIKDGRFGAYVTDGTTNATLRKGDEVESVTLERAAELLAEKRAAAPRKTTKKTAKKTTKTTAKKTTSTAAKKTAAKKTTAKKTTAAKKAPAKKATTKKTAAAE